MQQAWRILQEGNGLLYKIFKAMYFPHSHMFNAKLGNNPSYAWRGIWGTILELKRGFLWHIGMGTMIKVLLDQ